MIQNICPAHNSFLSQEASAAPPKLVFRALRAPSSYVRFPRSPGGPLVLFLPGPFPRASIPNLSSCAVSYYVPLPVIEKAQKGPLFLPLSYFVAQTPRRPSVHFLLRARSADSIRATVTHSARSFSKKRRPATFQRVIRASMTGLVNANFAPRGRGCPEGVPPSQSGGQSHSLNRGHFNRSMQARRPRYSGGQDAPEIPPQRDKMQAGRLRYSGGRMPSRHGGTRCRRYTRVQARRPGRSGSRAACTPRKGSYTLTASTS